MSIKIARLYLKERIIVANNLVSFLHKKGFTLSVAESFTGGLFSATISKTPGASRVFLGGVVTYSKQAKIKILQIDSALLATHGSISSECGYAMAKSCQTLFTSDIALSFTGNAGPKASENKPVGKIFITLIIKDEVYQFSLLLQGTRQSIQKQSILFAISQIFDILSKV